MQKVIRNNGRAVEYMESLDEKNQKKKHRGKKFDALTRSEKDELLEVLAKRAGLI
jgi:hypothetical protein